MGYAEVERELLEMRLLGMVVPDKALALARTPGSLDGCDDMSVSEQADLLIELANA